MTATLTAASTGVAAVLRVREASSDINASAQSVFPPRNLVSATGLTGDDIVTATLYRQVGTDLTAVRADGYGFQIEMAYRVARAGGILAEVPIEFRDRTLGRSKMSSRIVVEALVLVTWWGIAGRYRARQKRALVPG